MPGLPPDRLERCVLPTNPTQGRIHRRALSTPGPLRTPGDLNNYLRGVVVEHEVARDRNNVYIGELEARLSNHIEQQRIRQIRTQVDRQIMDQYGHHHYGATDVEAARYLLAGSHSTFERSLAQPGGNQYDLPMRGNSMAYLARSQQAPYTPVTYSAGTGAMGYQQPLHGAPTLPATTHGMTPTPFRAQYAEQGYQFPPQHPYAEQGYQFPPRTPSPGTRTAQQLGPIAPPSQSSPARGHHRRRPSVLNLVQQPPYVAPSPFVPPSPQGNLSPFVPPSSQHRRSSIEAFAAAGASGTKRQRQEEGAEEDEEAERRSETPKRVRKGNDYLEFVAKRRGPQ